MSKFGDFLEGAFNVATLGAEKYARQFESEHEFLGAHNGPADAARHVSRAAHLAYKSNETYAELLLDVRETLGGKTNADMDYYNNAIGIQIGAHLSEIDAPIEEIDALVEKLIVESMAQENWVALSSGIMIGEDSSLIELTEDLHVAGVAVMPKEEWRDRKADKNSHTEQAASSEHGASLPENNI